MSEQHHSENVSPPPPELLDDDLGIAGRVARAFINTPVTPMLIVGALCIGLLGLFFTPRQEDPKISVPMIDIFVSYPGATAKQVETLVTAPLERLMSEITEVRHVYSATMRGQAVVTVRFLVGQDMGRSIVKVHDKLQSNLDKIPPDVRMPLVKPVGIDDVPVVTLTLWSKDVDDGALRTLALDVLQRLGEVPNAGKGFVVGGRADQVRVEVLTERLAGYNLSIGQVAQTIQTANAEVPAGNVESGGSAFSVQTGSFLQSATDIGDLVVGIHNGLPIYVRDVANVTHAPEETKSMVTQYSGPAAANPNEANGEPAVTIAIAKKEGTNGVTVAQAILKKLDLLKRTMIPSNVHVLVTRDYGKTANDKVNDLLEAMFEAALIVSVLCLVGLGARAAFVVILVIPIVILVTIWWAWVVDYTIDRVSLFALIFSIGILVDDATVVVENIFRRWLEAGQTSLAIAIDAVREVGNPTILATFTIISALLPMGFVSGLMGPYMRPIPVLGSSAMFFSLIAAFVFTPWVAMKVRPRLAALEKAERREHKTAELVSRFYRPIIMPLVNNRALGIGFLICVIGATAAVCTMFYTKTVVVKMLPFDNKPEFSVVLNMPEGTALPETANVLRQLALKVRELPEVTDVQSYAGTAQPFNFNGMVRHYYLRQNPWEGDLLVMLKDKKERERGSHEIAVAARHMLTPLAQRMGGRIAVVEMPPGPPVLQTVVAEVHGPDDRTRRQFAADLTRMFEQVPNIADADNYMIMPYNYWHFEVDTQKAVRRGVSVENINNTLAMAMGGFKLGDVKLGTVLEPTYIVLQVPLGERSQISRLGNLLVPTNAGTTVPLAELGRFVQKAEEPTSYHIDLRPIEYVVGEGEGRLGAPIYGMFGVEDLLDNYTAPDGVKVTGMPWGLVGPPDDDTKSGFEWSGEWTVTYETFRDMGIAFMACMVLIYGLIVWEFRNFALAGLIMSPIPLTLIGIVPGHWLLGAEFTATSMIGLIALGGIIVRQSILIVEFVKIQVAEGKPVREAAIRGAEIRMRPIFITSLTTIAGAGAILFDPIFQGMAVSILFGAGVATVMAVIVIPLGCISARKQFYRYCADTGDMVLSEEYFRIEKDQAESPAATGGGTPLWMRLWGVLFAVVSWTFFILRGLGRFLWGLLQAMWQARRGPVPLPQMGPPDDDPPSGGVPPPGDPPRDPPPDPAPVAQTAPVAAAPEAPPSVASAPVPAEAAAPQEAAAPSKPARPRVAKTAAAKPAADKTETAKPATAKRTPAKTEAAEPQVAKPKAAKPKAAKPKAAKAEPAQPIEEPVRRASRQAEAPPVVEPPAEAPPQPPKPPRPSGKRGIKVKKPGE